MVNKINEVYGDFDNLTYFLHPKYKRHFQFLSNPRLIELSRRLANKIESSNYNNILVVESGASPFANLCKDTIKKNKKINWKFIKFPRDSVDNIFPVFNYYLNKKERKESISPEKIDKIKRILKINNINFKKREEILKRICDVIPKSFLSARKTSLKYLLKNINDINRNKYQEAISIIFEDTEINKFLSKPFLFFDEYIDSGTTLNNYQYYLNFITKTDFKIISYQIMVKNSKEFNSIYYTLYDLDTQLKCYNFGIYPFENRIDLIGYFYYHDKKDFQKIDLIELIIKSQEKEKVNEFIDRLEKWIQDLNLTETIKNEFKIKPVGNFINSSHVLRYCLFILEKDIGNITKDSEFLWLASDMYGPIWSPLPNEYHFEFMNVFENKYNSIKNSKSYEKLHKDYKKIRQSLLSEIALIFIERRKKWLNSIKSLTN
ncbi:MAG: hypothetical protein ABIB79_04245 [archaeon]